tara:strand:+ start:2279 stop:2914 length:636 start_codon:yes stop_codon:yes gene_type:complete
VATVSSDGKVAYIYDEPTDTWHPVAGSANTSQSYVWSGTHNFNNTTTFEQVVTSKAGVNNFASPAARDLAIPSPVNGTVVFVRTDSSGNQTNHIQYYSSGSWRVYGDNANLIEKSSNYTLNLGDGGKTFMMTSSSQISISVPTNSSVAFPVGTQFAFIQTGAGAIVFSAITPTTTTIFSKNQNKKTAAQYSQAILVKKDTDTWILMGDLTT